MSNPLFDTVFRATAPPAPTVPPASSGASAASGVVAHAPSRPDISSAPPVRIRGTRTRAGNAMKRTRDALMSGAARVVTTDGTKIAMIQVAVAAGVAKATLYNHFRTREAVLDALVVDQVEQLVAAQAGRTLADALTGAALGISDHPVRAGLARVEPAALAALACLDTDAAGWQTAAAAVTAALSDAGRAGTPTVLRWLASFLLAPSTEAAIRADVGVLLRGLPYTQPPAP